ncbi:MAG: hypothetical protein WDO16_13790 [Bacteroidota bacterium]
MKTKFFIFLFPLASGMLTASAQKMDADWQAKATTYIQQQEYTFHPGTGNVFTTVNTKNRISCTIDPGGYTVNPQQAKNDQPWQVNFRLKSIGRDNAAYFFTNNAAAEQQANNLVYHYGFADVEYVNTEAGLRENLYPERQATG